MKPIQSKITVGYVRVSTEEQAKFGVSLQDQTTRINAFGVATGREVAEIVTDAGVSAKSLKRPGIQAILSRIKAGEIGTLVVLKLDRLTRSVKDLGTLLETLEKHGCALVAVAESLDTSTASGRLMLNLLASVSQWEREATAERTVSALAYKRNSRMVYCKDAPFGWERSEDGKTLVQVPHEIDAIQMMQRLREKGVSLRKIGEQLTAQGIMPSRANKWYAQTIKDVLDSKMAASLA